MATYGSLVPVLIDIFGVKNIVCTHPPTKDLPNRENTTLANANQGEKYKFILDRFDIEEKFPYDDETFDIVIFTEVLEHISIDPCHTLSEINRITKMGGYLLLSTPNCASSHSVLNILRGGHPFLFPAFSEQPTRDRHNREYVPWELGEIIQSMGYEQEVAFTKNVYNLQSKKHRFGTVSINTLLYILHWISFQQVPYLNRGDSIFILAKKTSKVIKRYPACLYV